MGADDILDRLERFRNARTFPFYEDSVLRGAAAEIGRLRGEVAKWQGLAEAGVTLAEIQRRREQRIAKRETTAPAMPNGVEGPNPPTPRDLAYAEAVKHGLIQEREGTSRAADNRDAAGVDRSGITPVFRVCTAYEAGVGKGIQGRDVGNPYKPNTDEHEAWGYGFEQGRSVDEDEAELEFRPGDPDSPMPSQRAPAPVQAAPQEVEDAAIAAAFREVGACSYAQDGVAGELFAEVRKRAALALAAAPRHEPGEVS